MRRLILATLVLVSAAACGPKPATPPTPPPPPPAAEPPPSDAPPPPPAPPECKSLEEKCSAEEGQSVPLGSLATVSLPVGWTYAKTDERVITVSGDSGARLVFASAPSADEKVVQSVLNVVFEEQEITGVVEKALNLKKPMVTWEAGGLEVAAWQVEKPQTGWSLQKDDPELNGMPGALLIGVTPLPEGQAVVAVGFLLRSAPSELAPPIREAMKSIRLPSGEGTDE